MSFLSERQLAALGFAAVGQHVLISERASIHGASRIRIGSHVRIDDFCVLSAGEGGMAFGDYIHVGLGSSLVGAGHITVASFANFSSRVAVYSSNDDYSGESLTNPMVPERFKRVQHAPVRIGRHAIIGSGTVILPGVTLGDGVAIGALSLVTRDCEPFGVYGGVPARRLKDRSRHLLGLEQEFLREPTE